MLGKTGLSLINYRRILIKRKMAAIIGFFAAFLFVVSYFQKQNAFYRAVCSIKLIEKKSITDLITSKPPLISYNRLNLVARTLVNKNILEKAIYELGLVNERSPQKDIKNTLLSIKGFVKAGNKEDAGTLRIYVDYTNAEMAAKLANGIAQTYIELDAAEKNEKTKSYRILVEEQLAKTKEELDISQKERDAFKEENQEMSGIAIAIQNNISILEKQKNDFLEKYNSDYPDVVKINEQIEELNKELQALSPEEMELTRLTREYENNAENYRMLQSKLEDLRMAEKKISPAIKIVKLAAVPLYPISPNKLLVVILGLAAGFISGVFIALATDIFKNKRSQISSNIE